jgi:hypothetical protein
VRQTALSSKVDVMHVCISCFKQKSANVIVRNVKQSRPKLVIINRKVMHGTTINVYNRCVYLVAHSPIRGVHENLGHMKREVKRWTKYVGGVNAESQRLPADILRS